ncbi:glycosyltransferase [Pseudonocardia phyllosphaerae]|uniref:glycosyltransferase n=1 Tax=Pseudonocardia phyllosphaerae TaxID=3390502 RepID=UPI003979DB10
MRIAFFANAEAGHVLPLLPLAQAAQDQGHDVALFSSESMNGLAAPVPVHGVGPEWSEIVAENGRRHPDGWGGALPHDRIGPAEAADLYAGTRVDMTFDDALSAVCRFRPDLVVAEWVDYVGPMAAASLGVPWAAHGLGPALPTGFTEVLEAPLATAYTACGLQRHQRIAYVDPCPAFLQAPGWVAPDDRVAFRPRPHRGALSSSWSRPVSFGHDDRPTVLLTFGTMIDDPALYLRALDVLGALDVDVVVTWSPCGDPRTAPVDRSRVLPVGFVPLEQLLRGVSLVIAPGGAGTVLGSLSAGVPMVLLPRFADHRGNAERAAATGGAVVVDELDDLPAAVRTALDDPSYAASARAVAQDMETLPDVGEALDELLARVPADVVR